jgi:hypothetical protein
MWAAADAINPADSSPRHEKNDMDSSTAPQHREDISKALAYPSRSEPIGGAARIPNPTSMPAFKSQSIAHVAARTQHQSHHYLRLNLPPAPLECYINGNTTNGTREQVI